jgi:membrane protein implicated in regulation of membrane protease activity
MLTGIFDNLVFWHWWVLAIILLILEIFTPGAFFMWMSAAAGVVGTILLISPELSWQSQFMMFAVTSIIAIVAGKLWFSRNPIKTEMPSLNTREDELIGKIFEVEQAIVNGSGRIKVGESTWKANGPDRKAGESVKVTGVNGAELTVEPA